MGLSKLRDVKALSRTVYRPCLKPVELALTKDIVHQDSAVLTASYKKKKKKKGGGQTF